MAVDRAARALGLVPGMALADARAMHPGLAVADADPVAEAALLTSTADWCRRWTPLVGLDPPDGVTIDIGGSAHLFGGENALARDMVSRLEKQGLAGRVGIADTPEAAWALARFGSRRVAVAPPGGLESALRQLPVAALACSVDTAEALIRVGLERIEDVLLRPRAPIAARFGAPLLARLDAALGRTRSSLAAAIEAPPYVAERRFIDPVTSREGIEGVIGLLARDLCALLTRHGEGARRLEALIVRVDGQARRVRVGVGRPTRDPVLVARLFEERFEHKDEEDIVAGYGFELVRLAALEVEPLADAAPRLDHSTDATDLARLVDVLGARLGRERILIPCLHDGHWPDDAMAERLAAEGKPPVPRDPSSWNPTRRRGEPPDRPILILPRPEAIEAIAEVPDGPPRRFRWRRVSYDVAGAEGPERIAPAWWGEPALTRDYFRAETGGGHRFWLFREGLWDRDPGTPRWFMHGFFG